MDDTAPIEISEDGVLLRPIGAGSHALVKILGRGGMATVFLSLRGRGSERRAFVVKRLHGHLAADPQSLAAFQHEAEILGRLDHEVIPAFSEYRAGPGQPFLAMEHLAGRQLGTLLEQRRGGLPVDAAVYVATRVLDALAYAHEAAGPDGQPLHLVHRDVSPHNIFICHDGRVALLDFGIAQTARRDQTTTGVVKGKFAYIAPEQAQADRVDQRADVWSMGAVLWEMLAGRRLFDAESGFATLAASILSDAPALREAAPSVPHEVASVVHRALQRDREDRFPTTALMRDALQTWAENRPFGAQDLADVMRESFPGARERDEAELAELLAKTPVLPASGRRGVPRPVAFALLGAAAVVAALWLGRGPAREHAPATDRGPSQAASGDVLEEAPPPQPVAVTATSARESTSTTSADTGSAPRLAADVAPEEPRASKDPKPPEDATDAARSPAKVKPPSRPAVTARGRLSLYSDPWAEVRWRGRVLGLTPLLDSELPVGVHTLTLHNPIEKLEKNIQVTIKKGELTRKRVVLAP